jgi:outer membrane usher protein
MRNQHVAHRWLLCNARMLWLTAILGLWAVIATASDAAMNSSPSWHPVWLGVEVNGAHQPDAIIVISEDGRIWAERAAIDAWRLVRPPDLAPHEYLGQAYFALDECATSTDLQWSIDVRRQALLITAGVGALRASVVSSVQRRQSENSPATGGAFLNYDLNATSVERQRWSNGLFELGVFRGPVVFTQTEAIVDGPSGTSALRLDSSLMADFPQHRASLRLGDGVSSSAEWGHAVRFGGVQWVTNFATQPEFLTLPLPSVSGSAAVPSVVDVFVNGALAATHAINAGPFTISDLPVVSGSGKITARVRDIFGREQLISQAFYASPQLLRVGLDAYAFEAGKLRTNYGGTDSSYGIGFVQATWRRGLSDYLTGELHAQRSADHTTAGLSFALNLQNLGVLQAALAASEADYRRGALVSLGYDFRTQRLALGGQIRWTGAGFRELGTYAVTARQVEFSVHAGWTMPYQGSLSLAFAGRHGGDAPNIGFASATYSSNIGQRTFLTLTAARDLTTGSQPIGILSVTRAFSGARSVQFSSYNNDQGTGLRSELHRNTPAGTGVGYRLLAEQGPLQRYAGQVDWQGSAGKVSAEVSRLQNNDGLRLNANGSIGLLGGDWVAMRRMDTNFAVIDIPQLPGVPVYVENQRVAYTDDHGRATLTGLRAYERNRISVDPTDVPLDVGLGPVALDVKPYGHGGVLVRMPMKSGGGLLISLIQENREPVPAGARLIIGEQEYPVATDGKVYIAELSEAAEALVRWRAGECQVFIDPAAVEPLPQTARLLCRSRRPLNRSSLEARR